VAAREVLRAIPRLYVEEPPHPPPAPPRLLKLDTLALCVYSVKAGVGPLETELLLACCCCCCRAALLAFGGLAAFAAPEAVVALLLPPPLLLLLLLATARKAAFLKEASVLPKGGLSLLSSCCS